MMIGCNLSGLTSFFPWNLIIALFLAFTFAVVGIAIYRHATTKSEEEPSRETHSPFQDKWKKFVAQFGLFATTSFSKSFVNALNIMHSFIGGRQFRYQLPWIVAIGAKESGKSTILQALDLDRPIGRPHFSDEVGGKPLCDWWFYDHGIVLDLDGKIVLNPSHANSDEENWQLFLNLLAHHRPKRPLDGVVLTIPASELIGQTALSHDDIMIRAEYLYGKLWEMQRVTGIRVPVYLIVTKCDFVPGFESVCKSIPTHNKNDIFGWSNDEAVDAVYNPDWIDMAFSSVNNSFYKIQEEIYANGKAIDGRNGIFMFPLSFNTLKASIRTYADHIFKESSYHESFFLRGIYFVGDSHLDRALPPSNPSPLSTLSNQEPVRRNIYFVDNLFENKIFREMGLARPISRVLLGNTRAMRFAKVAIAVVAVIGTLGLLRANDSLQKANLNLTPALLQVDQTLTKIRGQKESTETSRLLFEDQADVLLKLMTQISTSHLSSVFIPTSWFDPLDEKIKYVMGLAFEQVIIRSMALKLDNMALNLSSLYTPILVSEKPLEGVDPLQTLEFYHLRNYTLAIKQLEAIAAKFNNFGNISLVDIGEIIKYLFNYDMPQSFYEREEYYIEAVNKTEILTFDFSKYQEQATTKLSKLFSEFRISTFDPDRTIAGLGKLQISIKNFPGTHNYAAYDVDLLRDIFRSLQETIQSIKNPGLNWLNEDHFDPGPSYEDVKRNISNSAFFNPNAAQSLLMEMDQNFINFRKRLAGYKSSLFNGETLFEQENGLAIANPSLGAVTLLQNLESFFNEPFMADAPDKTIATSVPIGTILLWDTLRLQDASRLVTLYNQFMNYRFLSLPKTLQPILQKAARESLTKNLISFIADAQIFNSDIAVESRLVPEDALLPQVQNYRVVAPYLEQLLIALRTNDANAAFSALKSVLTTQTYDLIKKLNRILNDEAPYAIKGDSFNWWDGKPMAALEAFGVLNINELKHYLELQRDRINYLAREFAEPLVSFLKKINTEGMPGNLPLLSKWEGIIHQLNEYDRKAPGDRLVELESYIMGPLMEVTVATCEKFSNIYHTPSADEYYFLNILIHIQEKLHEQCIALSGFFSVNYYEQLSKFFNANLAGKFPFVEKTNFNAPDADPEDIRTFFEMMDAQAAGVKATLQEASNLGAPGKKALIFIEQMEKVRQFFGGYLAPDSTLPNPAFSVEVMFRVNRERESYANEILDWELTARDTTITMRSPTPMTFWEAGDPLKMVFGWALNSPLQPMMAEEIPNYDVQGENAIFSYDGIWALLRLLVQHHASSSDFPKLNDETPITLRFDIPLTNVLSQRNPECMNAPLKAVTFIRLKVSPLGKTPPTKVLTVAKEGAPVSVQEKVKMGSPVQLPYFPAHAPRLEHLGIAL